MSEDPKNHIENENLSHETIRAGLMHGCNAFLGHTHQLEDVLSLPPLQTNWIKGMQKHIKNFDPLNPYQQVEGMSAHEYVMNFDPANEPELAIAAQQNSENGVICTYFPEDGRGYFFYNRTNKADVSFWKESGAAGAKCSSVVFQIDHTQQRWRSIGQQLILSDYPHSGFTLRLDTPDSFQFNLGIESKHIGGGVFQKQITSQGMERYRITASHSYLEEIVQMDPNDEEVAKKFEERIANNNTDIHYYFTILSRHVEVDGQEMILWSYGAPDKPKDPDPEKAKDSKKSWNLNDIWNPLGRPQRGQA